VVEVSADDTEIIYAASAMAAEVPRRGREPGGGRRAPIHLPALAPEPIEAGAGHQRLERLHKKFKRRINDADRLAVGGNGPRCCSGHCSFRAQITMRKVDGWKTVAEKPAAAVPLDLGA
jgi:hypothetical protein